MIHRRYFKSIIVHVQNINADTIIEILRRYVRDGSIVITDKCKAYAKAFSKMPRLVHLSVPQCKLY